ncbi:hypothetical protein LTR28_003877 [Elasticomyces elasticus]|nr:hypothetical protein LTR28_003877 [Elasticomyces elasticus]KAK4988165.1 hypothetical protein LTR50_004088 [Elasticomyces elasticus]
MDDMPSTPVHPRRSIGDYDPPSQDSPFSDYFSSSTPSVTTPWPGSAPTHKLLLRLNVLGAQILRHSHGVYATEMLMLKLQELEDMLHAPEAQTRMPADMADSGLFMEDDEPEVDVSAQAAEVDHHATVDPSTLSVGLDDTVHTPNTTAQDGTPAESKDTVNDRFLLEAQTVLARITTANADLRLRHKELKQIHEINLVRVEKQKQKMHLLRSENKALRSDLTVAHSELLSLKRELKAVEAQIDTLDNSANMKRGKMRMYADNADYRKTHWKDVDTPSKRDKERHAVSSCPCSTWEDSDLGGQNTVLSHGTEDRFEMCEDCKRNENNPKKIEYRTSGMQSDPVIEAQHAAYDKGTTCSNCGMDEQGTSDSGEGAWQPSPWQELCDSLTAFAGMARA